MSGLLSLSPEHHEWLDSTFKLTARGSSVKSEFRGALATFLTMCYILLVNPQLLMKLGLSPELVVVSTALSSATGCIIAGYLGNLPLGLAPGLGLSAYLTYGLVKGEGLTVQEAFTTCFISGILLLFFSLTGISQIIMKVIPRSVKLATIVGMGLQIAFVGMTSIKLVVANPETIVGLGDISNYQIWLSLTGLLFIGTLLYRQIEGGILLGIVLMTVITWGIEKSLPDRFVQVPNLNIDVSSFVDFSVFDLNKCFAGLLAFLFIGLIDVSGCIFGMASLANLVDEDGNIPGAQGAFTGVAVSTLVSAATGGTPLIVYVEGASGIKEGSRTGLSAIFIGFFFLCSLFLAPVLASIPVTATSPVAMLIGAMMMSQASEIDWEDMKDAIPAFLTMTVMLLTFSITNGIIFGLIASTFFYVSTGDLWNDVVEYYNRRGMDASAKPEELASITRSPASTHSKTEGHHLLDNQPFIRTPSFIVSKQEAEEVLHGHHHQHPHARTGVDILEDNRHTYL